MRKVLYPVSLVLALLAGFAALCRDRSEETATDRRASTALDHGSAASAKAKVPPLLRRTADVVQFSSTLEDDDPKIDVVHGFVIDRGGGSPLDWGYKSRQRFLDTLDRYLREVGLTEVQHRALLLAVYDYQEQMFALHEAADKMAFEIYEEEWNRQGTLAPFEGESVESWRERTGVAGDRAMRETLKQQPLKDELRRDLWRQLVEGLGPEKYNAWVSYCGPWGRACIEGIERSKYDLISIPGRAHLYACEVIDPCYDQRERVIGR
jgi:hypothetical protein